MEVSKTFVIPTTGTSPLCPAERPFCHLCDSLLGLQPLSYRCDWALEGLHDEVITDKAGTA